MQSNSQKQLRHICERLVGLEQQKAEIVDEIKETKDTAKADGFDAALITKTVKLLMMEQEKRQKALDQYDLLDTYLHAAGVRDNAEEVEQ